jgi:adenosylcobinamide-GDP ribazoletransferase
MIGRLLAAVQFLTIVPAASSVPPAAAAVFFPFVGACVGAAAGAVYVAGIHLFPGSITSLLALLLLLLLTGALHEDGLADVFDAFRAGRTPERIHSILKDSRIGTFGALALVMSVLLRWQSIGLLHAGAIPALIAAVGASRGAMVALAYISEPAGEGLGKAFSRDLRPASAAAAALQAAALPFLCGLKAGSAALAGNAIVILAARAYFHRRIGGVTGDCLGAVCQISETLLLLIFICPLFT